MVVTRWFSLVTFLLWPTVSKRNQCLRVQNCIHFECKVFTAVVFIKLSFSFLPWKFSSTCDVEWYSTASPELQKGVFLCLSRVFRGEKNLWIVLERPWQQQNLKVESNSGLVHENLLLFVQFPLLQMDFEFLCQSTALAKPLNVWVFWVSPFLPPLTYMWQANLWTVGAPNSAFYSSSQTE